MRIPHVTLSDILHFVEVVILAVATTFAGAQLRALRLQNSADLTLRLGQEFESGVNRDLVDALDSDPTTLILKRPNNPGGFPIARLGDYLGEYETLDDLYKNGLVTCHMIYNEFSYDLEKAYKNKDVMEEVSDERRKDGPDTDLWSGFLHLGEQFDKDHPCK